MNESFSVELIQQKMISNTSDIIIAYHKRNPVGKSPVLFDSVCPIKQSSVSELCKLYVLERFKGKGIGKALLLSTENRVLFTGYKNLNIEVYIHNDYAIKFYDKNAYT